jgi:LuxR family transcriptional regulator, maltose regulon positive regulatory protein
MSTATPKTGRDRRVAGSEGKIARAAATEPVLPAAPDGRLVPRPHLVGRLNAARGAPLVMLVAPAGYGKTALLAEWEAQDERPFTWVGLEAADNHPLQLVHTLGEALGDVGAIAPPDLEAPAGDVAFAPIGDDDVTVAREVAAARAWLRDAVRRSTRPFVLVVDDAQVLSAAPALDVLAMLIDQLPAGAQLALASRIEPGLPIGSLRARRKLAELRSADLVMTRREAAWVAGLSGVELDDDAVDLLVRRTEGWPAGLYLAALAVAAEPDPAAALSTFSGDDRTVADYLREQLLASLEPPEVEFLTRASVLDRLSGPLCDFVLERRGSARLLRSLSRSNLLIVPLDRTDTEYRFHRLFAQMLTAELRGSEPELERAIHQRASDWHAGRGDPDNAIAHAIASGDVRLASELLWTHAAEYVCSGRNARVQDWLARFTDREIADCPELALTAAASHLVMGDRESVERWISAAGRSLNLEQRKDRESLQTAISVLGAAVSDGSTSEIVEQLAHASETDAGHSPWLALACLVRGAALHLSGDPEAARQRLEQGVRRGAVDAPAFQVLCLSQLALLAIDRSDWDAAELLAARAKGQVERVGLAEYASSALVYAVSSAVQARIGRVDAARRDGRDAVRLLSAPAAFTRWYEVECRIALARAALRLSDVAGARTLLGEATRFLGRSPEHTLAHSWLDECLTQADLATEAQADGTWSLTTAELRVLQFLPTHLSFPEIAERLYVSTNTVKTHTRSVYRKLDASSRGEAVVRAREAGLLDSASG